MALGQTPASLFAEGGNIVQLAYVSTIVGLLTQIRPEFGRPSLAVPSNGYPHLHFTDEDRVAVVERAITLGFDLDEVVENSRLTPRVCWSIALRLARPNALELRQAENDQARRRAGLADAFSTMGSRLRPHAGGRISSNRRLPTCPI